MGVAVTKKTRVIDNSNGGTVTCRRLSRVEVEKVMEAAGFSQGDEASKVRFARLIFQKSVLDFEGVVDEDATAFTIEDAKKRTEKHPTLGEVMCVALYEVVDSACVGAVIAFATGREDQSGN